MGCRTTDFLLSRSLRSPETPPFIGLASLRDDQQNSALDKSREYLAGDPERIQDLFLGYPYVSAWCITQALSEAYGDRDQAIYRHIEDALRVSLADQTHRQALFHGFCRVCEKLGLPTRGFSRMVDVYLLHAGVPLPFLPELVRGFLRQEAAFGPPPTQATVLLNRWEDDSLEFWPQAIVTPRRAIRWDETAWHAKLFARIRPNPDSFVPTLPVEKHFKRLLSEPHTPPPGNSPTLLPKPRLIWRADGLAIRLPRIEGRVRIWQDDDPSPFRLRGGEDWALPQPWPARLQWCVQGLEGELAFLTTPDSLAIFDHTTGHLVKEMDGHSAEIEVDTTDAVILSRSSFSLAGEHALETGVCEFVAFGRLGASSSQLVSTKGVIQLRSKPRRRLTIQNDRVATGPRGALFGPSAFVEIDTGLERNESRQLRVTVEQTSADLEVAVVNGIAEVSVDKLFSPFCEAVRPDPLLMRVDLLAPNDGAATASISGISLQSWVWPAYSRTDGLVFDSSPGPKNLVLDQSQHVTLDSRGLLTLDRSGGYVSARAVFEIGGEFVPFDFPWPDVVVIRRRPDGSAIGLPMGTRLTADEENRFDTVTIRCPDPFATLLVRGRREDHPFTRGLSRNLAMRDLLETASDNKVILRRGNGTNLLLFELVPSIEPRLVQPLPASDSLRLRLKLMRPVDALALEIEDEQGKVKFVEAGFGRRPVSSRRPSWLKVELPEGDPTEVELTVSALEFKDDFSLARIFLRPDVELETQSTWHPLRNSRGETYAIILGRPGFGYVATDLRWQFEKLSEWLADCYSAECWLAIKTPLISRWKELGAALAEQPGGVSSLVMAAAVPPPDHTARSWIPAVHPIHLLPDLYGAPTSSFAGLSNSGEAG